MKKFAGYLLVALHALIFFFIIFQERIVFPPWIQSFGRIHPLFLHIPIGAIIIAIALVFFLQTLATYELINSLLAFIAGVAAVTALMGVILGNEEGYESGILNVHRIAGVSTSAVAWITYFIHSNYSNQHLLFKGMLAATLIVLIVAGHFGSVITHGDQYVLAPILGSRDERPVVSDSTSMFRAAVYPILEAKCLSCHNDNKQKGKLSMQSMAALMRGGEDGVLWHRGEPRNSLMISRLLLPEDHKDHMPPQGKAQLSVSEMNLLYFWIQSGADTSLAWTSYTKTDTVRKLAERLISTTTKEKKPLYSFDGADERTVASLNDPYRTVVPVALDEPALAATLYIKEQYRTERLKDLLKVSEQLVELNLDGMPVTDGDCAILSQFTNLEKLNLNFSNISSECLGSLAKLPNLKSLAVAGTSLDDSAIRQLKESTALKKLYIWNTSMKDVDALKAELPGLDIDTGESGEGLATLRLSPPMLISDEFVLDANDSIALVHKLPNVVIRYTTNGVTPDSTTSAVYKNSLSVQDCKELIAVACKPGWYCSKPVRFLFFKKGLVPTDVSLNTKPNQDYRGNGPNTLVDNKKGFADNYYRDPAWLGYRDEPFDASFSFDEKRPVSEIVISYARNIPSFLFPPSSVEVWGGDDKKSLKLLRKIDLAMPADAGTAQMEAMRVAMDQVAYRQYRLLIKPFPKLPVWHPSNKKETKDKRTWIFVDEVFFN